MEMVEVNTAELSGAALDWAVDVATASILDLHPERTKKVILSILRGDWSPSTDWSQGGPLISRFDVDLEHLGGALIMAKIIEEGASGVGATELIAACRAIVAAKLGETVSVPKELLP